MHTDNIPSIQCRFAQNKDIEFIYQSLNDFAHEQGVAEKFSQSHTSLHNALFSETAFAQCIIVEVDHVCAGLLLYSIVNLNFTMHPTPCLYVHDVYVHKMYRRKGAGKALGPVQK